MNPIQIFNKKRFKPEMFLLIQVFLFFIIISLITGYSLTNLESKFFVYAISIVIIVCSIYSIWSWGMITGRFFDPYVLFLVMAMLFTGGQAIIEIFNIKPASILDVYNRVKPNTVLLALFLVSFGLLSFQSGGLVAALQSTRNTRQVRPRGINHPNRIRFALRMVGWLLLLISFFPAISQLKTTINAVISGSYWTIFQIDSGVGFEASERVLSLFLLPGILFLLAGSKGKYLPLFVSILLILSFVALQFFIGSRRLAILPLLAYSWLWHRSIHPLPRTWLLISGAIFLFVVFPVISVYRATAGDIRIATPSLILQAFNSIENPLSASLAEMASTVFTVAWTLELVPAVRPFALGSSYYLALSSTVPNLFWSIHPASANELARWLSWTVSPAYAAKGGGWGYSFVAEAYLNVGWLGMPFVLMIIGYFYARFVLWANNSNNPAKMAFLASFSSFFYMFARGEFASMPRYFVWYSLLPYMLVIIISNILKTSKKSELPPIISHLSKGICTKSHLRANQ